MRLALIIEVDTKTDPCEDPDEIKVRVVEAVESSTEFFSVADASPLYWSCRVVGVTSLASGSIGDRGPRRCSKCGHEQSPVARAKIAQLKADEIWSCEVCGWWHVGLMNAEMLGVMFAKRTRLSWADAARHASRAKYKLVEALACLPEVKAGRDGLPDETDQEREARTELQYAISAATSAVERLNRLG